MIVGAWFYCSEFSDFLKCIREAAYSKSSFSSLRCASDFFPLLRARPNPEMDFRLSRKSASDDDDDDDNKRIISCGSGSMLPPSGAECESPPNCIYHSLNS